YPRMNFLETALGSKFNPIVALGKARSMGFINKFNGEAEILDDLVRPISLCLSRSSAHNDRTITGRVIHTREKETGW
ncbi:unnamed protein product, partial [Mycena citricolor]